jgi:hypothetical protein
MKVKEFLHELDKLSKNDKDFEERDILISNGVIYTSIEEVDTYPDGAVRIFTG